jgi:glycosyltransferase involved in cell wall biosynthesis
MANEKVNDLEISLICTVKNEESSLKEFLDSLLSQYRQPNEIIIVDGGSLDMTIEIINSYIEKGAPIKLIVKPGVNIAEGRNIAIENSKNEIIASTDAGCKVNKDWLKNLIKPFKDPKVDVVAGWYEADARNLFERCVVEVTYPKLERVMKNPGEFLPSSRSVSFKKKCWKKVGGYPNWLYTGEDTLFDLNLKKGGCRFEFAKDAMVLWKVRPTLKDVFNQYFLYQRGNGQAGLPPSKTQKKKYIVYGLGSIMFFVGFFNIFFWAILLISSFAYLFRKPLKTYKKFNTYKAIYLIPLIIFVFDLGSIFGYFFGTAERILNVSTKGKVIKKKF